VLSRGAEAVQVALSDFEFAFQAHLDLLRAFLAERESIAAKIEGLLNAQRKPVEYLRDRRLLAELFESCVYAAGGLPADASRLRGRLERAHWARGFKPRVLPGIHNDLVDPAEMMVRAFHMWRSTRWPGHAGRARYAHTLLNLYLIRQLALLAMRAWDDGASAAGEKLAQAQSILDAVWRSAPPAQPAFVRNVRWLIPVAQSPGTEQLAPYFEVAEQIAATEADEDRVQIHDALVRTAGGHLRSYLHYQVTHKGLALYDAALILLSRKSNALDYSLLIQALVPLLEAYERAVRDGNDAQRRELADAICQGISPDPELFVNRVDLLAAYSMVEYLFTAVDSSGHVGYTPIGRRHVRLLEEYAARMGRLAKPLHADCLHFQPIAGAYSPYGAFFGVSSNLLEHMALKSEAVTRFSLEDVFTGGDADKVAWVDGWRKLSHVDREVQRLYAYSHPFAAQIFERIEHALRAHAAGASAAPATGRLYAVSTPSDSSLPELAARYLRSSDRGFVAAHKAQAQDEGELLADRLEGLFLVSYATPSGWLGVTKDLLTDVLGAGHDAKLAGLPIQAVETLQLMGRDLIVVPS
jgi:hypothetical protein